MKLISTIIRLNSEFFDREFTKNSNILFVSFVITIIGTSIYGITIGLWRGPLQAIFVSIKLPLLIIVTTALNSLINWFISLMIGANFSFLRTLKYQFLSYAIASIILLSFVPISLFFLWNAPSISGAAQLGNSIITLLHVCLISIAGVIANVRLFKLLKNHLKNKILAKSILYAWLAGNMILGCQMSWILRPFIGSPDLQIQFLRPKPLKGNFYIDVFSKAKKITSYKGESKYE